jgi:hypothetical protein
MTENISNRAILGGVTKDGNGCWQFAEWTKWAPMLAPYMMDLINENLSSDLIPHDEESGTLSFEDL